MKNSRIQLALIVIFMLVGLYFVQTRPVTSTQSGESVVSTQNESGDQVKPESQVALREVSAAETTEAEPRKVQAVQWTPEVKLVDEIINSKNDNDPRLDSELRVLSEEAKVALRTYYLSRPEEDRNGKGTVLFVLGRNLKNPEDVRFMADALKETPCRSLADCTSEAAVIDHRESQHDTSPEVTLAYPKIVTLAMFEKELNNPHLTPQMQESILEAVQQSLKSEEPIVKKRAAAILDRAKQKKM